MDADKVIWCIFAVVFSGILIYGLMLSLGEGTPSMDAWGAFWILIGSALLTFHIIKIYGEVFGTR